MHLAASPPPSFAALTKRDSKGETGTRGEGVRLHVFLSVCLSLCVSVLNKRKRGMGTRGSRDSKRITETEQVCVCICVTDRQTKQRGET